MQEGWIGNWSPGIGDPTAGGWITVALYAWAAWVCYQVLRGQRRLAPAPHDNELLIWRLIMLGMVCLGINKQLDLQSAVTELARAWSYEQGWYENRRQYQQAFIAAAPIVGATIMAMMTVLVWGAPTPTLLACAGTAGLIAFVAVRAASFHHMDEMLGWRLGVLPLNWILEMGSLLVIGGGAIRRRTKVEI